MGIWDSIKYQGYQGGVGQPKAIPMTTGIRDSSHDEENYKRWKASKTQAELDALRADMGKNQYKGPAGTYVAPVESKDPTAEIIARIRNKQAKRK